MQDQSAMCRSKAWRGLARCVAVEGASDFGDLKAVPPARARNRYGPTIEKIDGATKRNATKGRTRATNVTIIVTKKYLRVLSADT
jgi:hypothetical protein